MGGVLTSPYPEVATLTAVETAFGRWLEALGRQEGCHVFIYRDYLYTAWLAGKVYADNQGI